MIRPKNSKGFTLVEALLIILILTIAGLGGLYVYSENSKKEVPSNTTENTTRTSSQKSGSDRSDEEQVVAAVKKKFPSAQVVVREYSADLKFAKGTAGDDESGFAFIAKKQNNTWELVYSGQELPSKEEGEKHGMPVGWYSMEY